LASRLGLRDASTVYRWERGRIVPSLENALRLSTVLSMPVEFLFRELREELHEKGDLDPAVEQSAP
jgi:transcriptional regulator with XRE-family HTH domain